MSQQQTSDDSDLMSNDSQLQNDTGDASLIGASVALAVVGCVLVVVVIVAIILLWIRHRNRLGRSPKPSLHATHPALITSGELPSPPPRSPPQPPQSSLSQSSQPRYSSPQPSQPRSSAQTQSSQSYTSQLHFSQPHLQPSPPQLSPPQPSPLQPSQPQSCTTELRSSSPHRKSHPPHYENAHVRCHTSSHSAEADYRVETPDYAVLEEYSCDYDHLD